jgi:polyribonucleotide 5'-hydroxyl-kinase
MFCCLQWCVAHRVAGTGPRPPSSALPLGQVRAANPLKVTPVVVSPELEQSLLAVSHAQVG